LSVCSAKLTRLLPKLLCLHAGLLVG
jgi:hypothetical protein